MSDLNQYELDELKEDQENTLETHQINGRIFFDLGIYQRLQVDSLSTIERLSAKVAELEELQKETLQACSDILTGKFEPFKFNDSNRPSQSAEVE